MRCGTGTCGIRFFRASYPKGPNDGDDDDDDDDDDNYRCS